MDLVGSSVVWAPWWCSSTATVLDGGRLGVGARGERERHGVPAVRILAGWYELAGGSGGTVLCVHRGGAGWSPGRGGGRAVRLGTGMSPKYSVPWATLPCPALPWTSLAFPGQARWLPFAGWLLRCWLARYLRPLATAHTGGQPTVHSPQQPVAQPLRCSGPRYGTVLYSGTYPKP